LNDPPVPKTREVDLALMPYDDELLRDVALSIVTTAPQHDAPTRSVLPTVPGIGTILSLVRLDASHAIGRLPGVQDFASYARLVTCSKASAGKRLGTSGQQSGHAHLTWAFSEAATLCLRHNPNGQKLRTR
jgi:transposase